MQNMILPVHALSFKRMDEKNWVVLTEDTQDTRKQRQRLSTSLLVVLLATLIIILISLPMSWLRGFCLWPLTLSSILQPLVKYTDSGTAAIHLIESEGLWQGLKGGEHCLRYATREYTARLSTIESISREGMMRLCRETPVEIHGKVMYTDFCQDLGFGRGVWGFWSVDFDEPDCETRWGEFIDLGCVLGLDSSHSLRVESRLENLPPGSNWQVMCATTPADIHGHHYGGAVECFHSPSSGTHGIWDLPDVSCDSVD